MTLEVHELAVDVRTEQEAQSGRWITPSVSYIDPVRKFCTFCGRPIARRFWQTGEAQKELVFCDPSHAHRHTTYPKSSITRILSEET